MIRWIAGLFRRRPPLAPDAKRPVMHLFGPGYRPACGEAWGPAAPMTVEAGAVGCPRCRLIAHRRAVDRHVKRR